MGIVKGRIFLALPQVENSLHYKQKMKRFPISSMCWIFFHLKNRNLKLAEGGTSLQYSGEKLNHTHSASFPRNQLITYHRHLTPNKNTFLKKKLEGISDGSAVKNSHANAIVMVLIPDPGRSHMP